MKTSAISSRYLARDSFDGSLNLTRFPESTNRPVPEHQRLERRSRHVTGMKSHVAKEMARVHAIVDRPDSSIFLPASLPDDFVLSPDSTA